MEPETQGKTTNLTSTNTPNNTENKIILTTKSGMTERRF